MSQRNKNKTMSKKKVSIKDDKKINSTKGEKTKTLSKNNKKRQKKKV
jgi:hypothetical protein